MLWTHWRGCLHSKGVEVPVRPVSLTISVSLALHVLLLTTAVVFVASASMLVHAAVQCML